MTKRPNRKKIIKSKATKEKEIKVGRVKEKRKCSREELEIVRNKTKQNENLRKKTANLKQTQAEK